MFEVISAHLSSIDSWRWLCLVSDAGFDGGFTRKYNVVKLFDKKQCIITRSYERILKNGKIEGLSIEKDDYYPLTIIPYVKGKRHGKLVSFRHNGEIGYTVEYDVKGKKHGEAITYYKGGRVESIVPYKHGKVQGKHIWYYENGKVRIEGHCVYSRFHGKTIKYYENGQIEYEDEYKDGELIEKRCYDENGNLLRNE